MKVILLQKFLNSNGYLTSKFHSYDGDLASPVHSWWWSCFTTSTFLIVIRIQEFMSQDDLDLTQQFHFHDSDLAVWSYSTIPLSWWWYSDTGATTFGSNVNEMLHLWLCMWMEECFDRKKKKKKKSTKLTRICKQLVVQLDSQPEGTHSNLLMITGDEFCL